MAEFKKKHQGIVFRKGNEAVVFTDIKPGDKTFQYSIQPYLDSARVNNVQLVSLNQPLKTAWFVKNQNFIQFLDKTVYLFNAEVKTVKLSPKLKADYILISGNPYVALNIINNNFDYHTMVIDGSNSDSFIGKITKLGDTEHTNYKILKRNKFIISYSNARLEK